MSIGINQATPSNQQGYLTMVTVVLIVIMGFIAVAMAYVFSNSAFSSSNLQEADRALYLAESGLEQATRALFLPDITDRKACSGLTVTNSAIGNGTYNVTATGPFSPSTPTTLSSALNNSATSISVVSTTGYQSTGRIMIDRELINYTAIDTTHFLNATRGVDDSTATTHTSGTAVGQYQCQLTSSGGVPTLTPVNPGDPGGIRQLTENIQLQEAWTVGAASSNRPVIARFNEVIWSNVSNTLPNAALNSINMLSYDDGWAVGDNQGGSAFIAKWNGTTWSRVTLSGMPNVVLNSISCTSSNNCYAVGNNSSGPVILQWNGSTWTRPSVSNSANQNLNSVYCDASNDCWAVGASSGGARFYQWNGSTWTGVTNTLSGYPFLSVFCNTSTDCWAVGSGATFGRKNGASWANFASGLPNGPNYNSVYCNDSTDCWVVGDTSGGEMYAHWDGSSWTRFGPYSDIPNIPLNSVMCANANDCWAVGNASSGDIITHWDGSTWSLVSPSGSIPNVNLNSVYVISPKTQPWSNWVENF